jgi:hypothetical protein
VKRSKCGRGALPDEPFEVLHDVAHVARLRHHRNTAIMMTAKIRCSTPVTP